MAFRYFRFQFCCGRHLVEPLGHEIQTSETFDMCNQTIRVDASRVNNLFFYRVGFQVAPDTSRG